MLIVDATNLIGDTFYALQPLKMFLRDKEDVIVKVAGGITYEMVRAALPTTAMFSGISVHGGNIEVCCIGCGHCIS